MPTSDTLGEHGRLILCQNAFDTRTTSVPENETPGELIPKVTCSSERNPKFPNPHFNRNPNRNSNLQDHVRTK